MTTKKKNKREEKSTWRIEKNDLSQWIWQPKNKLISTHPTEDETPDTIGKCRAKIVFNTIVVSQPRKRKIKQTINFNLQD